MYVLKCCMLIKDAVQSKEQQIGDMYIKEV